MRSSLTGVLVDDQDKALQFSAKVAGFKVKTDIPMVEPR